MTNLWKKEFKAENIKSPRDILDEQANILAEMTNGVIIAKTDEYEGRMRSGKIGGIKTLGLDVFEERDYDVQTDLGEISDKAFRFEFFITSTMTPNFKYRAMLFEYDITFYPVQITLDETIANELKVDTYIECDSLSKFTRTLSLILNSKKIETVINALLSMDNDI